MYGLRWFASCALRCIWHQGVGIQQSRRIAVVQLEDGCGSHRGGTCDTGISQIVDQERRIEPEQPLTALTDGVRVKHPVGAAEHQSRHQSVGKTEARRPVVAVGMNQGPLKNSAVLGKYHRPGRRVEVGKAIFLFPRRRGVFVADSHVQCQFCCCLKVILQEIKIHVLTLVHDREAGQSQLGRQAQQEIPYGAPRESIVEVYPADRRVQVVDPGLNVEDLRSKPEEVPATSQAQGCARIP